MIGAACAGTRCRSGESRFALAAALWAASMAAPLDVHAAGSCSISSTGLAFGAYQPLTFTGGHVSLDKTSTVTVSIICSGIASAVSYALSLGAATYGTGDRIRTRALRNTSGGSDMLYNIYTGPNFSTVWGNGSIGALMTGSIASGNSSQAVTGYGLVPAGQSSLEAGSFSDVLSLTLTYDP